MKSKKCRVKDCISIELTMFVYQYLEQLDRHYNIFQINIKIIRKLNPHKQIVNRRQPALTIMALTPANQRAGKHVEPSHYQINRSAYWSRKGLLGWVPIPIVTDPATAFSVELITRN